MNKVSRNRDKSITYRAFRQWLMHLQQDWLLDYLPRLSGWYPRRPSFWEYLGVSASGTTYGPWMLWAQYEVECTRPWECFVEAIAPVEPTIGGYLKLLAWQWEEYEDPFSPDYQS